MYGKIGLIAGSAAAILIAMPRSRHLFERRCNDFLTWYTKAESFGERCSFFVDHIRPAQYEQLEPYLSLVALEDDRFWEESGGISGVSANFSCSRPRC